MLQLTFAGLVIGFVLGTVVALMRMSASPLLVGVAWFYIWFFRSGILSVDSGQFEAAAALGIGKWRQLWRITLPQAMRTIIPTAANELIQLLKGTSAVYIMALPELFHQAQVIYSRNGTIIALLLVAAVWYLILITILSVAQHYIERYFAKGTVTA